MKNKKKFSFKIRMNSISISKYVLSLSLVFTKNKSSIQYAKQHNIQSLTFVVYIDGKHVFNGIYSVKNELFPREKLQILLDNVLALKWYIPVKSDEALGVCLTAAIRLAQENQLEHVDECREFIEKILPEAFRKVNTSTKESFASDYSSYKKHHLFEHGHEKFNVEYSNYWNYWLISLALVFVIHLFPLLS